MKWKGSYYDDDDSGEESFLPPTSPFGYLDEQHKDNLIHLPVPAGESDTPQLQEGVWYDLNPPAIVAGETFHHVFCEYQVPREPDQFVMRGIPEGGNEKKSFVLIFKKTGRVRPTRSKDQN